MARDNYRERLVEWQAATGHLPDKGVLRNLVEGLLAMALILGGMLGGAAAGELFGYPTVGMLAGLAATLPAAGILDAILEGRSVLAGLTRIASSGLTVVGVALAFVVSAAAVLLFGWGLASMSVHGLLVLIVVILLLKL
jgi:hypothetical protein